MCAFLLMMTGCASSMKVSPSDCKVVATQQISPPPDYTMEVLSTPITYPSGNVTKLDIITTTSKNNTLWKADRTKANGLQQYIKQLQDKQIIGK